MIVGSIKTLFESRVYQGALNDIHLRLSYPDLNMYPPYISSSSKPERSAERKDAQDSSLIRGCRGKAYLETINKGLLNTEYIQRQ